MYCTPWAMTRLDYQPSSMQLNMGFTPTAVRGKILILFELNLTILDFATTGTAKCVLVNLNTINLPSGYFYNSSIVFITELSKRHSPSLC